MNKFACVDKKRYFDRTTLRSHNGILDGCFGVILGTIFLASNRAFAFFLRTGFDGLALPAPRSPGGRRDTGNNTNSFLLTHEIGDEVVSIFLAEVVDITDFVLVADTVAAVGNRNQFGPEGAANELRGIVVAVGLALNQSSNG
eukprot:CAMPEP_0197716388 /NCGR_PEP_ID=MMETSP1434-20131217/1292_1 /TAXON_ID=265543 /ORGANISM="Minutocellus polymorphus, Strain CCMP3303" /LENGTH=142 /DNA_ID=CAMNT_0043300741 /DNA_START=236 /DNA_END=661 /DNA_ORIENTATION=+